MNMQHEAQRIFSCLFLLLLVFFSVLPREAAAASLTFVSDTISTSIPGNVANHTIQFTIISAVPTSGRIILTLQAGAFTVPAGLDYTDIDFLVGGVNKNLAPLAGTGTGGALGTSIVSGATNTFTFTLNDTDALAAGSAITIKIGTNAAFGVIGDQQVKNPFAIGSHRIEVKTMNSFGVVLDKATAMVAVILPIRVIGFTKPSLATLDTTFAPTAATTTMLVNPDGTKLLAAFPQNFVDFPDDIRSLVLSFQKENFLPASTPPSSKTIIGKVFEIKFSRVLDNSTITNFSKPIVVDFYYTDSEISGVSENTLTPYRWDGFVWTAIPGGTVFPNENRVSVPVSQFSALTLMGEPISGPVPIPSSAASAGSSSIIAPSIPHIITGISG